MVGRHHNFVLVLLKQVQNLLGRPIPGQLVDIGPDGRIELPQGGVQVRHVSGDLFEHIFIRAFFLLQILKQSICLQELSAVCDGLGMEQFIKKLQQADSRGTQGRAGFLLISAIQIFHPPCVP